jgi:hypothetical protein
VSPSSHQTARLSRGKHRDPEDGTCVMELASMLAGEEFSDSPRSVCPIVAGFLRTYNDGIDDNDRDDLYRFAAEAVGTRGGAEITAARARLCHAWLLNHQRELLASRRLLRGRLRPRRVGTARADDLMIGTHAGRLAARLTRRGRPGAHAAALALVERMLEPELEPPCVHESADDPPRARCHGARTSPA